ncbi:class I SAM-dependent methyltransferase [Gordonia soli]|uniref:Methyltransferase domain-containing protein n=1 Tax=Gordonia soli NBRC 108243 TaxID=1223545 RepID=M0QQ84_9ACTN|nr:class I SAM-dependent methyltransferase [Gordonia soli]GAC69612.1 hypothetical protein GS4_26_00600 [Gordonia soli NBRC 108243]
MTPAPGRPRWNHNIHYHSVVLSAIPESARSALDVGTGNGLLAVDLRRRLPDVTAIDCDTRVLDAAAAEAGVAHPDINWIADDVMSHRFDQTFDVVASVATLHHLPDLEAALLRYAELANPGGVVVIIGLAKATRPREIAMSLWGVVQHRWYSWRRGLWEHDAPTVWPPPHSYRDVRSAAGSILPGASFRQLPMFRYAIVWRKTI